jgi:hypothetical protein
MVSGIRVVVVEEQRPKIWALDEDMAILVIASIQNE